jgi:lytic murein transglycosylase
MDRRAFLALILAGAADSGPAPTPRPSPAPEVKSVADASAGDPQFDAWLRDFTDRSIKAGLPAEVITREFAGLRPDPAVLGFDNQQPEFSKPIGDYINGVVTGDRVALGQRKRAQLPWLPAVEARYGVPAEILISIWAVESAFGAIQGDFDVLRSLATLAAEGRRRDWAEDQLTATIRILADHKAVRAQLRGSWAGAMGQTQLEPTTYLTTAVAWNGGDQPDIWGSSADALASAANLLAKAGWKEGEAWDREVRIPAGFDYGLTETVQQSTAAWAAQGIQPADGGGWLLSDADAEVSLIVPAGAAGPAFLVLPNHFVIRQYNNSTAYALAVGLLADRIAGGPGLVAAWPSETPLSLADRLAAQAALAKLGYDPGPVDGKIGVDTRKALRNWQKARKLLADGYLSLAVVQRLQAEAAALATPASPDAPPI